MSGCSPLKTKTMLKVDNLSFAYRSLRFGHVPVLDGLSIEVPEEGFVSILGPSGCGKSTLFSILTGKQKAKSGSFELASPPSYMPQKDLLLPWRTVLGNAILSADLSAESMHEAKQQALRLIPVFGLSGYENYLPADLSGGMRQRVALLRTVMQKRCFLLLDEPLGALDALTRRQMQQWLLEVKSELGLTVLMTTHDIDEASYLSDIVYVLSPRPARSVLRLEPSLAGRTESNKLIARALGLRD
jgi:ABC-type nitrate/sulfonate/bicarbonate transport system ATPase subunit